MRQAMNSYKIFIFSALAATLLVFTVFSPAISAKEKYINNYMLAKSESGIRFDGIYQAVRESGNMYLRFYHNGKACSVYAGMEPKHIGMHFLRNKYRNTEKIARCGNYSIEGSKIKISAPEIDFWGDIRGDTIVLEIDDHKYNYKATKKYWFIKGPEYAQRPEILEQKKERKKAQVKKHKRTQDAEVAVKQQKMEKIKKPHIESTIAYDKYGRPESIVLNNTNSEEVARKVMEFQNFNPNIIARKTIIDSKSGKTIITISYDAFGKPINNKWLCLDKNGNMVIKKGKPVLINTFSAMQRMESRIAYDGSFRTGKNIKIFPCSNCAKETGVKDCVYVW
jgi:hypothetical protein